MNKIIILNGPNLNLLGEREKNQYGSTTLNEVEKSCKDFASKNNIKLSLFQSNIEGEIITPLCSIATFLFVSLYFFNKSNIELLVLIITFFPFNCIFAIIKLFNIKKIL